MDIAVVTVSSRGQLVLPLSMRRKHNIQKGGKVMLVDRDGSIVARPVEQMAGEIEDEIYMMGRAARGWGEIEAGRARKMKKAEFLKELSTW
ncbi:MAG: AbrB/MazE/SpoVT family DNA-binding domain-containing protein [Candidatus Micrarchaeia archaeon]